MRTDPAQTSIVNSKSTALKLSAINCYPIFLNWMNGHQKIHQTDVQGKLRMNRVR